MTPTRRSPQPGSAVVAYYKASAAVDLLDVAEQHDVVRQLVTRLDLVLADEAADHAAGTAGWKKVATTLHLGRADLIVVATEEVIPSEPRLLRILPTIHTPVLTPSRLTDVATIDGAAAARRWVQAIREGQREQSTQTIWWPEAGR